MSDREPIVSLGEIASERIDLYSYSTTPPERVCSFWWTDGRGVTCSSSEYLAELAKTGIASPPEGALIYPRDGRVFFDNLTTHFSGSYLRAVLAAESLPRHSSY